MEDDNRAKQMVDEVDEVELSSRRDFLQGLKKWSQAVIGGVVFGALMPTTDASAWVNSRGSWINGAGVGGGVNRGASWINGGGSWINSGTNWINCGGTWINGGGGWINRGGGWLAQQPRRRRRVGQSPRMVNECGMQNADFAFIAIRNPQLRCKTMNTVVYNIPVNLVHAYFGKEVVVRSQDPEQLVKALPEGHLGNLAGVQHRLFCGGLVGRPAGRPERVLWM